MTPTPRAVSPRARRKRALLPEEERQWRSAGAARESSTRLFDHIEQSMTKLRSGITKPGYAARKGRSACHARSRLAHRPDLYWPVRNLWLSSPRQLCWRGVGVRLRRPQGHVARQRHLRRGADELRRPGRPRRRLQMPREEGAGLVERVHGLLRTVAITIRGPEGVAGAVVA